MYFRTKQRKNTLSTFLVFFVLISFAGACTIQFYMYMIWHVLFPMIHFTLHNNCMKWTMQESAGKCFCMYNIGLWSSVQVAAACCRSCICKPIMLPYVYQHAYFNGCCTTWTIDTINQLKHSAPFVKILKLLINFVVNALSVILVSVTAQLRMSELEEALVLSSIRWPQSDVHQFIHACTLIQCENWSQLLDLVESRLTKL